MSNSLPEAELGQEREGREPELGAVTPQPDVLGPDGKPWTVHGALGRVCATIGKKWEADGHE